MEQQGLIDPTAQLRLPEAGPEHRLSLGCDLRAGLSVALLSLSGHLSFPGSGNNRPVLPTARFPPRPFNNPSA